MSKLSDFQIIKKLGKLKLSKLLLNEKLSNTPIKHNHVTEEKDQIIKVKSKYLNGHLFSLIRSFS